MEQKKLDEILKKHQKWLDNDPDGRRADLRWANLQRADLQRANLRWADLQGANLQRADLQGANLRWADLQGANLQRADLQGANLRWADLQEANLQGADLFNTCLPLWRGGLNIKLDRLQMAQLAYHFCSMDCEDDEVKSLQKSLYKLANEFADSRGDLKNRKYEVDNG